MDSTCYAYDGTTGEYLGTVQGDPSPMEPGAFLYPAHTTLDEPPTTETGEVPVRRDGAWHLVPDHRGETWFNATGAVTVDSLGDPSAFSPPLFRTPLPAPPPTVPDGPTLSDWRVGLLLWGRRDELLGKVEAEKKRGTAIGAIADERVNYANQVFRAQLLQLATVFGFTESEIDESLWRADRVAKGDLSGVWPPPAAA